MVWPSRAVISSPSIRIDNFFCDKVPPFRARSLAYVDCLDVAAQTATGFVEGFLMIQAGYDFILRTCASRCRQGLARVTPVGTRFFRRFLLVFKPRIQTLPAVRLR